MRGGALSRRVDVFSVDSREYTKEWELPAQKQRGWVHEVEVPLRRGEAIEYETANDGPIGSVAFNIHSHKGPDVTYHAEGKDARMSGTFVAPWEGKFYLMWENVSKASVGVRVRAGRHVVREETIPEETGHHHA